MSYHIISADSHITEPPDTYVDRIDPKWRDRAPRMQYHDKLGALAAYEWNFGEAVLETVRHHHNPSNSKTHSELVEIVALADDIAKDDLMRGVDLSRYKDLKVSEINLGQIYYDMDMARCAIREIGNREI